MNVFILLVLALHLKLFSFSKKNQYAEESFQPNICITCIFFRQQNVSLTRGYLSENCKREQGVV